MKKSFIEFWVGRARFKISKEHLNKFRQHTATEIREGVKIILELLFQLKGELFFLKKHYQTEKNFKKVFN